jgi:hypothetical protein
MTPRRAPPPPPAPDLRARIVAVRGQRVILDADLAALYGVTTKRLNEQVKRNLRRFPRDFMFRLTRSEAKLLAASRSQIATLKRGQNVKHLPHAFTENGAVMAANVLASARAVRMSVVVVRAFIRMRDLLANSREFAAALHALEARLTTRLDGQERMVLDVLRRLMELIDPPPAPPVPPKELGFHTGLARPARR